MWNVGKMTGFFWVFFLQIIFVEDKKFGEIQYVSDLNPPENYEISFNFMTNFVSFFQILRLVLSTINFYFDPKINNSEFQAAINDTFWEEMSKILFLNNKKQLK